MKDLLKQFENKKPEIVFEWNDTETDACGWIVINSLRGGAACGGTRMREGLDRHEVESLAKTMEVKFTVSGPSIGGAKSGINFNPNDSRKTGVLERWFKAIYPLLKNYYGTGGDLNMDEVAEVIPITEEFGLWHPQEGIVNGFYQASEPQKIKKLGQLRQGVSKVIEDPHFTPSLEKKYKIADMITGYGVAQSAVLYYNIWGGSIKGKRAIIQGWGNVAGSAAFYLSKMGCRIVGIIDKHGGIIDNDGLNLEQVTELLLTRKGNKLYSDKMEDLETVNQRIWEQNAQIFIPAASSRLVSREQVEKMFANGLEVISCGANVPFADPAIFLGPTGEYVDNLVSVIPDFIANCGMARVFAYLMQEDIELTDASIFNDVSDTIRSALEKTHQSNPAKTGITQSSFEIALRQLI